MDNPAPIVWPPKHDVFGVLVSATRYEEVVEKVIAAARTGESALVDFMPVHGLIPAVQDPSTWPGSISSRSSLPMASQSAGH